jgi:hypothetical protein
MPALAEASENNCSTIESLWSEEKLGPPPLQEDAEWCFAYASANLVSIRLGKLVSAKRMALDFHQSENYQTDLASMKRVGGYVSNTLLLAVARGVCAANDINESYFTPSQPEAQPCVRFSYAFGNPAHFQIRDTEGQSNADTVRVLNKILDKNRPAALSLNLGFMLERGRFLHAVTIVGRKFNSEKNRCEYQAVDSNKTYPDAKPEYQNRKSEKFLTLTADEILQNGIGLDFLR